MPRYYFNLANGRRLLDKEGMELPDAAAARREATRYAVDLMRHAGSGAPKACGNVVVTDERGDEVLTVTVAKSAVEKERA